MSVELIRHKRLIIVLRILIIIVPVIAIIACVSYKISCVAALSTGYGEATVIINEVVADNLSGIENEYGQRTDWIELFNCTNEAINLEGYGLSDSEDDGNRYELPDVIIKAGGYLVIYADGMQGDSEHVHTDFSLKASGETIILSDSDGIVIDEAVIPALGTDLAYGYMCGTMEKKGIFPYTTPGKANPYEFINEDKKVIKNENITFSHESGFYDNDFLLSLTCNDSDAIIVYTLDGSVPGTGSLIYRDGIEITDRKGDINQYVSKKCVPFEAGIYTSYATGEVNKANIIRARVYKDGALSEETWTKTYYVDKDYNLPVISIGVNPDKLFNESTGLYMPGQLYFFSQRENFSDHYVYGNYSLNTSVKANIEIFDENGQIIMNTRSKLRLTGCSGKQTSVLKNFKISSIENDFDPVYNRLSLPGNSKNMILKGFGGWPTHKHLYENAFINNTLYDMNIGTQYSKMSILYLDGEFWGLYCISEDNNEKYYAEHYGIDKDDIVVVDNGELKYGSYGYLEEMQKLFKDICNKDMKDSQNYKWLSEKIDIDNYIKYMITEIYVDNLDWLDNNVVMWKSSNVDNSNEYADGKWRFFLHDLDHALVDYKDDTIERLEQFDLTDKEDCTYIVVALWQKLWENNEFQKLFNMTFEKMIQDELETDFLLEEFDKHVSLIQPYVEENIERTTGNGTLLYKTVLSKIGNGDGEETYEKWLEDKENVREYLQKRPDEIRKMILKHK